LQVALCHSRGCFPAMDSLLAGSTGHFGGKYKKSNTRLD
jgi:hypothetical protein